jgi:hypothetical protein
VHDLLLALARFEDVHEPQVHPAAAAPDGSPLPEPPALEGALPSEEQIRVEGIFQEYHSQLDSKDLNRFWEKAVQESDSSSLGNGSVITYEQAKKLGLAPKE